LNGLHQDMKDSCYQAIVSVVNTAYGIPSVLAHYVVFVYSSGRTSTSCHIENVFRWRQPVFRRRRAVFPRRRAEFPWRWPVWLQWRRLIATKYVTTY